MKFNIAFPYVHRIIDFLSKGFLHMPTVEKGEGSGKNGGREDDVLEHNLSRNYVQYTATLALNS
jgi:hypothetical protein